MGCSGSEPLNPAQSGQRRIAAPKTPVLLFYIPGPVKNDILSMCKLVNEHKEDPIPPNRPNIRFIEIPNHHNVRKLWYKEITTRREFACSFYFADLRDHPTLLLTARTVNWFIRNTLRKYVVYVITLYDNKDQLDEFRGFIDPQISTIPLSENDPQTIENLIDLFRNVEVKYNEQRKTNGPSLIKPH